MLGRETGIVRWRYDHRGRDTLRWRARRSVVRRRRAPCKRRDWTSRVALIKMSLWASMVVLRILITVRNSCCCSSSRSWPASRWDCWLRVHIWNMSIRFRPASLMAIVAIDSMSRILIFLIVIARRREHSGKAEQQEELRVT